MGLLGARAKAAGIDGDRLFRAGVSYLHSHAYALAYACFDRLADDDWQVAYNKALCCFGVGDYERCYTILCAVESLLPVPQSPDFAELPDTLLRWEHESPMPICPLCFETFTPEVTVLFFRLKAEADDTLALLLGGHTGESAVPGALEEKLGEVRQMVAYMIQNEYCDRTTIPHTAIGWDLVRVVNLGRWAYLCGYVSEEEMWHIMQMGAEVARRDFSSWAEFGLSYTLGRGVWHGDTDDCDTAYEIMSLLLGQDDSPWRQIAW